MSPRVRIAMASKRNYLTIAQKYEVVKTAESERKIGVHKLGKIFGCGKTQISTKKESKSYMKPMPLEIGVTPCSQMICESKFSEVNEASYQWYLIAISKN